MPNPLHPRIICFGQRLMNLVGEPTIVILRTTTMLDRLAHQHPQQLDRCSLVILGNGRERNLEFLIDSEGERAVRHRRPPCDVLAP